MEKPVPLGATGILVSPMGLGTWQWGDYFVWRYGQGYADDDLRAAFERSLEAGINFIDTAEIYGRGRAERLLGEFMGSRREGLVVATKFMPLPWRLRRSCLLRALRGSLKRLGIPSVDLYQIHWPFRPRSVEVWAEALGEAVVGGLTRAAGVSNFSAEQTERACETLARRGVALASNQVEYNLLNRRIEHNGVMECCRRLGVTIIAYSPLAKGLLSGKYGPSNPPPGLRRRMFHPADLEALQPLIGLMREIGQAHGGASPSQVALNWLLAKEVIPIPGAKNARQAAENAAALGWRLTAGEVKALDEASDRYARRRR